MPDLEDKYKPAQTLIGAILRQFTREDDDGLPTGTFSDTTDPTSDTVDELIKLAAGEVLDEIAVPVPDDYVDAVQRAAAYRVAALILEDTLSDPNAAPILRANARYLTAIENLKKRPWQTTPRRRYLA